MFKSRGDRWLLLLPLTLWALLLSPCMTRADERHYLIIFGAQSHPKLPRYTHTFATFVKVGDCPADGVMPPIQAYTISWLPQTLKVRPFRCYSEPGVNLDLETTLRWAQDNRMRVSEWGPYEIEGEFYQIVYNEYLRMQSGIYRYKAIDPFTRGSLTTDCIHAVSDIDYRHGRAEYFFLRSGNPASRHLAFVLSDRERVLAHQDGLGWLNSVLGLDRYPIIHRRDP
ncbi:MAG TPA: hypothetical protein VN688_05215 [Gemmataceae bacterium]|nr:hypothetical protein [Gemmataceae bacterium]